MARDGGDPLADRRRAKCIPSFAAAAEKVWGTRLRQGWRHPRHGRDWWRSFENYVLPRIGQRPVSEVTAVDVLEILFDRRRRLMDDWAAYLAATCRPR